ncbi:hypothetical protein AMTR_s00070p00035460 [Amborella trichopoda]|uniref:Uncharacterized protein n=1 Tax=Amborella trichopoda TaxID=13333 RepID=U5DGH2_AMBTC|nr:hypothetical protein AMTR_s00070p00035460 [Amborella trichopoda]
MFYSSKFIIASKSSVLGTLQVEENGHVIGLTLKKTPSFVDLVEKLFKTPTALPCKDEEDVMDLETKDTQLDSEKDDTQLDSKIMDLHTKALGKKTKNTKAEKQHNKAINFPATSLTIGTWEVKLLFPNV